MEERELTLLIEFENGIAMRRIVSASALSADREKGLAAEDATRGAAATWGLPDFTFRPLKFQRGRATREAGDVILAVPHRAASVQVKSREAVSEDPVRERKWLDKKIAEAIRQADGTIRAIKKSGGRELTNERGHEIRIGTEAFPWARVVVLDHPGLDDYTPSGDAVVLLRRDWEFLFEQLKSVSAVLDYLHRVGTEQIALGTEPMRYYQYALADAAAAPGPLDPNLVALGFRGQSEPILPTKPAGDDGPHIVVRTMLEDIAVSPGIAGTGKVTEQDRFEVLAAMDIVPVGYREELGTDILSWMDEALAVPEDTLGWHFRNISYTGRPYLLFGACSKPYAESLGERFRDYVSLRHQQHLDLDPTRIDTISVGILLTPRLDGYRPWDTTMIATRGDMEFGPKTRHALELVWGPLGTVNLPEPDWDAVAIAFAEANEEVASEETAQLAETRLP